MSVRGIAALTAMGLEVADGLMMEGKCARRVVVLLLLLRSSISMDYDWDWDWESLRARSGRKKELRG